MAVGQALRRTIKREYDELAPRDYKGFLALLREYEAEGTIRTADLADLIQAFPDPTPKKLEPVVDEDGQAFLRDPPDPGPLARFKDRGWMTNDLAKKYRCSEKELKRLLDLKDSDVTSDIQENALHILGRCNNPSAWGENRTGLVYGMVQSGKTANMIALMELARRVGYRLFIILAGDKSSLREQTQERVNKAFELDNGVNKAYPVHSPTFNQDLRQAATSFMANFKVLPRFTHREDWATIIVIKKNIAQLKELVEQIELLKGEIKGFGKDFAAEYPTLILDDEADFASQNTATTRGEASRIHRGIVNVRKALPRNTYVGYTATPQACLSADPDLLVGYPRHFFWLLEPFMDEVDGVFRPRSYVGALEVFRQYDRWLLHPVDRDDWPHYEKSTTGKLEGIYVPMMEPGGEGKVVKDERSRKKVEELFVKALLKGNRPKPRAVAAALIDFMLGCGVRWWREWRKDGGEKPSTDRISNEYKHHAAMIHLSEAQRNQEAIRDLVQKQWHEVVELWKNYDPVRSAEDHPIRQRWRLQTERTSVLRTGPLPAFHELRYFVNACIEITERPIFDHRGVPYVPYQNKPFIYLLNSSDDGMELFYGKNAAPQVRTKRAAIVVGGNILSRGLTIEGLCVSVFGRASRLPLADATLQMGRWFGHKVDTLDLISIFMQDEIRSVFAEVAEADRYLRLQIKEAIFSGYTPMQVLLELRNSPFFRITSPNKSRFLQKGGVGFAGKEAVMKTPSFRPKDIAENLKILAAFEAKHKGEGVNALDRGTLYEDVAPQAVIKLLNELKCPDNSPTTFSLYADYLKEWRGGSAVASFPKINVAIMNFGKRQREMLVSRPATAEEARKNAKEKFGSIVGGAAADFKGDAFLDRPRAWHKNAQSPSRIRGPGDPILIAFYRLDPNYVTRTLYPRGEQNGNGTGAVKVGDIFLQPTDPLYVEPKGNEFGVVTFVAWTPSGGPMYDVATNSLIDPKKVLQRGRDALDSGEDNAES